MRVWLVNPFEPLPAAGFPMGRYRALARELAHRGHQVCWWSTDFFHFGKQYRPAPAPASSIEPYEVRLVHAPGYRGNQSLGRAWSHAALGWRTLVAMSGEPSKPQLILGSAPPVELAAGIVNFARKHTIQSCLDVTDIWPDSFAMVLPQRVAPLAPLLLGPHRRLMGYALKHCAAISSVSETYLDWALRLRGGSTVPTAILPWAAPMHAQVPAPIVGQGPFQATFCGTFGVTYDFDLMLEAARWLHRHHPGLFVINLVGDGPRRAEIQRKVTSPNVRVVGPVGDVQRNQILGQSAAGLCCYVPKAPQSLPIKLFDYLSFGLPVVNTLPGELRGFLEHHGAGLTVSGAQQLGRALCHLRDDREAWARMSRAAMHYTQRHTLEQQSSRLADFLESLVQ